MVIQERFYTAEDLWNMLGEAEDDVRLELIDGELIEMTPAGGEHGAVAFRFGLFIGNHVVEKNLGHVTAAETGFILYKNPDGKDTVAAPDVGFVALHRAPQGLPKGFIPFPPDLAVEVISPYDRANVVDRKVKKYRQAGTPLLWLVYPDTQSVVVHTLTNTYTVEVDGTLDGGNVLPNFTLPLSKIFSTNR
jgi:Uma2 family endonuclease